MMNQKKRVPLVTGHAEDFHVGILKNNLQSFRAMVGRAPGVYVRYNHQDPYYVGLASSMRSRLSDHLKDRLRGKWDRFSFFEIKKKKYLKDVESLLIRAAKTKGKGNKRTPDFAEHRNIKAAIKAEMKPFAFEMQR